MSRRKRKKRKKKKKKIHFQSLPFPFLLYFHFFPYFPFLLFLSALVASFPSLPPLLLLPLSLSCFLLPHAIDPLYLSSFLPPLLLFFPSSLLFLSSSLTGEPELEWSRRSQSTNPHLTRVCVSIYKTKIRSTLGYAKNDQQQKYRNKFLCSTR